MVKVFVKYTILLTTLILSVYCLLGTTYQVNAYNGSPIKHDKASHIDLRALNNGYSAISTPPNSSGKKRNYQVFAEVNEAEEDELTHSKKKSKDGNYFTSLIDNQIPEYFFQDAVSQQSLRKHFSYYASFGSRYILFQDIRI